MPKISKIYIWTQQVRPTFKDLYQEVEYIQSSGTQYIDTWVYANPNYTVTVQYQLTDLTPSTQSIFWTDNSSDLYRFNFRYRKSDSTIGLHRCKNSSSSAEYRDVSWYFNTNTHTVSLSRYWYVDWTNKATFSYDSSATAFPLTITLFALDAAWWWKDFSYIKLYYSKIYDTNWTTLSDFL